MKIRIFEFPPTMNGRSDFRLAYEAFRSRDPAKCVKEERQWLAQIQRALEAVSEPVGDLPDDADLDARFRKLAKDGGSVRITQKAHEKLENYLEECQFMAGVSAQVEDFRDRWGQAAKAESDSVPSGPVAVVKAEAQESAG